MGWLLQHPKKELLPELKRPTSEGLSEASEAAEPARPLLPGSVLAPSPSEKRFAVQKSEFSSGLHAEKSNHMSRGDVRYHQVVFDVAVVLIHVQRKSLSHS